MTEVYRTEKDVQAVLQESFTADDGTRMYRFEQYNGTFEIAVTELKRRVATGEWEPLDG
jgi:hypothetical protein